MSLAAEIQKPRVSNIFLLELTAGFWLRGWVQHSATAWKVSRADYLTNEINTPTAVIFNGSSLSPVSSIAAVEAVAGRWAYIDGVFYVRPPTGEDIHEGTTVARVPFYFSSKEKIFNNRFYDPRLTSVPNLSVRIEPRFFGVGQIGSGSATLRNEDGLFDELAELLDFDAGFATFKMGIDSNAEMAYGDYESIGVWKVERTDKKDSTFVLHLRELKTALETSIPLETFSSEDYPEMEQSDVGEAIPRAYGKIYGARPILIDAGLKKFKLAGHAVYDILEIRIQQDNVWTSIPVASRDLTNAEFTLGAEWANAEPVSVDFIGRVRSDGKPMYNAAEIIEDLLGYLGETSLDTASFTAAIAALDIGTESTGLKRSTLKPSLYISSPTPAIDIIGDINAIAASFLYISRSGQWYLEVFKPKPLGSVDYSFTEVDVLENTYSRELDSKDIVSSLTVRFGHRHEDDWAQSVDRSRTKNQYAHGLTSSKNRVLDAALWDEADAEYLAERILTTEGEPLVKHRFEVPWQAFFVSPGDNIHFVYSRHNLDTVLEVLEVRHDLINGKVLLVCGDRRGWQDTFGWWVADSQAAWTAGLSTSEKTAFKQTSGFWHGDDNLAISTDGRSGYVSRWW